MVDSVVVVSVVVAVDSDLVVVVVVTFDVIGLVVTDVGSFVGNGLVEDVSPVEIIDVELKVVEFEMEDEVEVEDSVVLESFVTSGTVIPAITQVARTKLKMKET